MIRTSALAAFLLLAACSAAEVSAPSDVAAPITATSSVDREALDAALVAQPDEIRERYRYRRPGDTLAAIGLEPGMTVVDALPGSEGKGWYTGILARYLGAGEEQARLIGMDYSVDMWPEFSFANDEFIAGKQSWAEDWKAGAKARLAAGDFGDANIEFDASTFGGGNGDLAGQADAVLFMRALHNLNRFNDAGGYLDEALATTYAVLKPGGVVGVVQHRGAEDMPDDWADGSNGYLKQSDVIAAFKAADFELVTESEINANPADRPTAEQGVWRLPPTLGSSREDAELKAEMEAIGESDRMTLVFRKPG